MGTKLVGVFFCLLFAVPFGGVGVYAAWAITGMVKNANAASDWVVVKATVDQASLEVHTGRKGSKSFEARGQYRYTVGGKQYLGTQLGLDTMGSSTKVGNWDRDMAEFLLDAKETGQPISVYMNPDNPAQSVVDRNLRWALVGFLAVFGIVFGSVGVGALVAAGVVLFAPDENAKEPNARKRKAQERKAAARAASSGGRPGEIVSDAGEGVVFIWLVAFFWNLITVPVAYLAVRQALDTGNYWLLFVLLFPLIGLFILWAAITTTWGLVRRGNAMLKLDPDTPRGGQIFTGVIRFERGVAAGQAFDVRLQCERVVKSNGSSSKSVVWSRDVAATATQGPEGTRLTFRTGAPASKAPQDELAGSPEVTYYEWRIDVRPAGSKGGPLCGFPIRLQPKAGHESEAAELALEPETPSPQAQAEALFHTGFAASRRTQSAEPTPSWLETRKQTRRKRLLKNVLITAGVLGCAWLAYDSYTLHYATP